MLRATFFLIILSSFTICFSHECRSSSDFDNTELITINQRIYTVLDFKNWWNSWKEADTLKPEQPDIFIEWHLMAEQASQMELYQLPTFVRKIDVFLKARTLQLLQREEIDSKIIITDDEIEKIYQEEYLPIFNLAILKFDTRGDALSAFNLWKQKELTVEELIKTSKEINILKNQSFNWLRPGKIPKHWLAALADIGVGQAVVPESINGIHLLLYLNEIKTSDEKPGNIKSSVRSDLRKEKHGDLTLKLVSALKEKYAVKINEELFQRIKPDIVNDDIADEILVVTNRNEVTVSHFIEQYEKHQNSKSIKDITLEEKLNTMRFVLNSMVANSIISWEALDRHYEEKIPFKLSYEFYVQNRLIKELKEKIFGEISQPTAEEVLRHYRENTNQFSEPGSFEFVLAQGDKKQINDAWVTSLANYSVAEAAKVNDVKEVSTMAVKINELDETLLEITTNLSTEEISRPFSYGGKYALLQLKNQTAGSVIPFEKVKKSILAGLVKERIAEEEKVYVRKLKDGSNIAVNYDIWNKLKRDWEGRE